MPQQEPAAKTILIVEDDPLLIKMYKTKFVSEGYSVFTAFDGEAGLSLALEKKPDLIILDVMMPKLSGIDMLKKLKGDAYGRNVPVIILSNLSQEEEAKKAFEYGAKEYLVKANFTPGQVFEKVKQYI